MAALRKLPSRSYFKNKRVLIRVDWNVSFDGKKIRDQFRIERSLATIRYVAKTARSVLVVSHLGSPKPGDTTPSLAPAAQAASRMLKERVYFLQGTLDEIRASFAAVPKHAIACMENIRFYQGERENSPALAKTLASFVDVVIDDAFAEAHRSVASTVGIARYLPHFSGLLMQEELKRLDVLKTKQKYPFVVVLGGAKLETKLPLVKKFLHEADAVLVGGGIANTFLAAGRLKVGSSLYEKQFLKQAKTMIDADTLFVPIDFLVASSVNAKKAVVRVGDVDPKDRILDIGPETKELYAQILKRAKIVFWNGPMGYAENTIFAQGTKAVVAQLKKNKTATVVIGGGDTLDAIDAALRAQKNVFVSTGGGAMLYYLSGKKLPGIEVLKK